MSIPTTMKFRVRGKSVELKNREGSSPSIPKKKPILIPHSFFTLILFFYQLFSSNKIQYLSNFIHSVLSQKDSNRNPPPIFFQFQSNFLCFSLYRYDTCTNEHICSRNLPYLIIHLKNHSSYHYL